MTTIAGRFVIDADDDHDWDRVIVCAIKVQLKASPKSDSAAAPNTSVAALENDLRDWINT
jgi:hypothetical protein